MFTEMIDDEVLIGAVELWPGLWNKGDKYHYVRSYTQQAWDNIAKEVGAEAQECKKRWIRLRDYFVRITRQKKTAKEQGIPFQRKKWYLYEKMMFLIPMCSNNEDEWGIITSNIGIKETMDNEGEEIVYNWGDLSPSQSGCSDDLNTSSKSTTCKSNQNKRKRKSLLDLSAVQTITDEDSNVVDDPNELFFKSLLPSLDKLNDIEVMEFRIEVQSLLLKYLKSACAREQDSLSQESASTSGLVTCADYEEKEHQNAALENKPQV